MDKRANNGRRPAPQNTGPSNPEMFPPKTDNHELGSMSDSGLMSSMTERRGSRGRVNHMVANAHTGSQDSLGYNQMPLHGKNNNIIINSLICCYSRLV